MSVALSRQYTEGLPNDAAACRWPSDSRPGLLWCRHDCMTCRSTISVLIFIIMLVQRQNDGSEAAILDRILQPEKADLEPGVARYILSLDFLKEDRQRMDLLAVKAREGSLSPEEEREIENYRHVGHLLNMMRSKARLSLKNSAS